MTPTTVEMLAARPKEQRCLQVLAWAKWSSGRARIFTTASGSLVAPSCSTHTRTVSTLSASPMTSWHLTSQACESQCATEQPKRFCCNGSAFASRSWKQGAGKAVTRCEENGFDKKFVQKVLNKIITKQPLPRTTGWSEGDSAKPQSFQCKQNGFRSQKIQHSPLCFVVWRLTVTWGYNICWIRMLGICRDTASCSGRHLSWASHGKWQWRATAELRHLSRSALLHCFSSVWTDLKFVPFDASFHLVCLFSSADCWLFVDTSASSRALALAWHRAEVQSLKRCWPTKIHLSVHLVFCTSARCIRSQAQTWKLWMLGNPHGVPNDL